MGDETPKEQENVMAGNKDEGAIRDPLVSGESGEAGVPQGEKATSDAQVTGDGGDPLQMKPSFDVEGATSAGSETIVEEGVRKEVNVLYLAGSDSSSSSENNLCVDLQKQEVASTHSDDSYITFEADVRKAQSLYAMPVVPHEGIFSDSSICYSIHSFEEDANDSQVEKKLDNKNIEEMLVAAKFGKYDQVPVKRSASLDSGLKVKWALHVGGVNDNKNLMRAQSCFDFLAERPEYEIVCKKINANVKSRVKSFKKACAIYRRYQQKIPEEIVMEFEETAYQFKTKYPNYYEQLTNKFLLESALEQAEETGKLETIASCKRILAAERKWATLMGKKSSDMISKSYIKFYYSKNDPKEEDLEKDFEIACEVIQNDYPDLFIYLINKYCFLSFLEERKIINRNKGIIIRTALHAPDYLQTMEEILKDY